MEYVINIRDIFTIVKKNLKIVVALALVFGVIAGGYIVVKNRGQQAAPVDLDAYKKQTEVFNDYNAKMPGAKENMKKKLTIAYDVINKNPVTKVETNNVDFVNLIYAFSDQSYSYRTETFKGWINKLDCEELFATKNSSLQKYKNDYVYVSGDKGEVVVSILKSDKYNYNSVAKKLDRYLKKQAQKSKIEIINSEKVKVRGFSQQMVDRQEIIYSDATRLSNELISMQNYKMEQPAAYESNDGLVSKKSLIFLLGGMIFGALLGAFIVSFNVVRKGIVMTSDQIEDLFEINKIAEGRIDDRRYPAVIDAVLNAIVVKKESVMIVDSEEHESYQELTESINECSIRNYVYVVAKEDDITTLEKINEINRIVIPVSVGKTSFENVQRIIKWSKKFNKDLIGYIIVNQ